MDFLRSAEAVITVHLHSDFYFFNRVSPTLSL
uniref:Macaca fascicularis brain cDNA clone: QmoA-10933, similar to human O-acyltransferase (membrane bound) domain containing 1(OACT1), mRNA, RefSeq: XM_371801.2 n=1 Tax=Macaca fascicularis TaxID=9541 RepID=I7GN30_MACFA|nr:unnamed protein product [Macaca fascicularis]